MNQPRNLVEGIPFPSDKVPLLATCLASQSWRFHKMGLLCLGVYAGYRFSHTYSGTLITVKADVDEYRVCVNPYFGRNLIAFAATEIIVLLFFATKLPATNKPPPMAVMFFFA